jgi:hypothetical protein
MRVFEACVKPSREALPVSTVNHGIDRVRATFDDESLVADRRCQAATGGYGRAVAIDEPSADGRELLSAVLLDEANMAARRAYAATLCGLLTNVAGWLAVDSWLGGGKVGDTGNDGNRGEAFAEFRAVATVVCMSAELADGAVTMVEKSRSYASATLVRPLIECEYLLVLFADDLDHARRWRESTPTEIRSEFTPKRLRRVSGFEDHEYWTHCDIGGHPAPKGSVLLEWLDPTRGSWPFAREGAVIDLGFHLERTWRAVDRLLMKHHARYEQVRSPQRQEAAHAWDKWLAADAGVASLTAVLNSQHG